MSQTLDGAEASELLARLAVGLATAPVPLALVREGAARRRRRTRRVLAAAAAVVLVSAGIGTSMALVERHTSSPTTHGTALTPEMMRFQGTWEPAVSNAAPDGQQPTAGQWPLLRITFRGDRFTTGDGVHTITGQFHVGVPAADGTSVFSISDLASTGGRDYRGPALPPLLETLRLANRSYHHQGRILVLGGRTRSTSPITMTIAPLGSFVGHLVGTVKADAVADLPLAYRELTLVSADGYPSVDVSTDGHGRFDAQVSAGSWTFKDDVGACLPAAPELVRPGHSTRFTLVCPS